MKFYGSPVTPFFYNWAFNVERGPDIAKYWNDIPSDTNVLITHGPPRGILDRVQDHMNPGYFNNVGCDDLLVKINNLSNLKLFVGGHLHYQGGQKQIRNDKIFVNASMCDESYQITRKPVEVEI